MIAVFILIVNKRHAIILCMKAFIAVDIGGTQIRVAVFPEHGTTPIQQQRIKTVAEGQTAVERLIGLIEQLWPKDADVISIAIAAPGFLDPKAGVVVTAPNIAGWVNLPIAEIIQQRFNVPVYLGNDANLAALGEWHFGAGRGYQDILYITVSTGIGGGLISEGRLVEGAHGMAGELGHVMAVPDGPLCGCGKRGHLEAVAAGPAIARYVVQQIDNGVPSVFAPGSKPSAKEIAAAAKQGDALSIESFNKAGFYIGRAVADFLHILNPSLIIFGGGVSLSGDTILTPLKESMREHVMSQEYLKDLRIVTTVLGDDSGLIGALALMLSKL